MVREVEIVNKLGLHARPAALFVRWVIRFKSTITIWKGEEKFSAASLLDVLTANLNCGARVVLEAIGPSNPQAPNSAQGRGDGAIFLNYTPSGEEMWDNATLNEELWHVTGLMTLRSE